MNKKVKNTNFENVYYYMGYYILIDEKNKMFYVSRKSCAGGYNGKEFAIERAIKHIEETEKEDKSLYENIERKLCNLVKKDLTRMVYNTVQHERDKD